MISPELIRRYPFFAGLSHEHLVTVAKSAHEESWEAGHTFFDEGDRLGAFYLVLEGAVSINFAVPDRDVEQEISGQLTGEYATKNVTLSTVGTGTVFGWSALIPPTIATAGAQAVTDCRVIAFDCTELLPQFEKEQLGCSLTINAAKVIRERLRDMRIESLAFKSD